MQPWLIVVLVIAVLLLAALVGLYIYGTKMQKKSETAQAEMWAGAQTYSILVIDKKMMKMKEAGFPKLLLDQTPKYMRNSKVPVVKAKIGPKVTNLMCDPKIFDLIPVKKEVKAVMNGIYIMDVKGLRSALDAKPAKQGFFQGLLNKAKSKLAKKEKAE